MVAVERRSERTSSPPGADAIPPGARRRGVSPRQVLAVCLFGALVLAFFASRSLPSWADRLGEGGLTPLVRGIALGWNRRLAPLGLTGPYRELHRALNWLREQQWP